MNPVLVLRHVPHVPLGSVADVFADMRVPLRQINLFEAVPERLPLEQSAGLVVLGGPMSANDVAEHPYLDVELGWIREAVDREMPLLGICLGAQLLAKALGERVYRNRAKEIGWYDLELLPAAADDPLFRGRSPVETVFQWHGDTFDLPAGAVHLARSRLCPHQAFRYGRCAYGLQFHVEMTLDLMEQWLCEPGFHREVEACDGIDPAVVRSEAPKRLPAMASLSQCLLRRFVSLCRALGKEP